MEQDPRSLAAQGIEVWRPVPETSYEASNLGRLRNVKTGRCIGTSKTASGYFATAGLLVHRAVLSAFDGARPPNIVARHKDNDRAHNVLTNLEWGTRAENAADTARAGRLRHRSGAATTLDLAAVAACLADVRRGAITQKQAAKTLGRSSAWISNQLAQTAPPARAEGQRLYTLEEARVHARAGNEIWVEAPSLPAFEVSNFGRVRAKKTGRVRTISPDRIGGYPRLVSTPIHRLVLSAFSDPPFEGALIRHTPDPDRKNNSVLNLEWGTYAENGADTRAQGHSLQGENHPRAAMTDAHVQEGLRRFVAEHWTTEQLGAYLGVGQGNAANIVAGKTWKHIPRPEALLRRANQRGQEAHPRARVTEAAVTEALTLAAVHGWGAPTLARHLGVSMATGTQILSGKTWKHIPRAKPLPAPPQGGCLDLLTARVREKTQSLDAGFQLQAETTCLLTREELIRATEESGPDAVETALLPLVVAFFQAHVARYGWFYPTTSQALPDVLSELTHASALPHLTSKTRIGNAFLQAHFRSFWDVDDGPVRRFSDPNQLTRVVKYRLGLNNSKPYTYTLSDGRRVTTRETFDINIKNIRRGFTVQHAGVSFFKPQVATAIYRRFLTTAAPVVWDPSSGFGARLLGFAAAFPNGTYYGNEPASATRRDLEALKNALCDGNFLREACISARGSEEPQPFADASLDLVFTSPPYFDLERYFDEPSQCWKKYPTEPAWRQGYLYPTLQEAARGLKPGGRVVFNVDTKRKDAVLDAAANAGFVLETELPLHLGHDAFARKREQTQGARTEPVLVFQKL